MGVDGYKKLVAERKENFKILKTEMEKVAEKFGERVLETKNNPISIGKPSIAKNGKPSIAKKHIAFNLWCDQR